MLQIFSRFMRRFACYRQPTLAGEGLDMMLHDLDLNLTDGVIFAVLAWLLLRYTWMMTALALLLAGGALWLWLPPDPYDSLLPLALMGLSLGMLLHHYQQRYLRSQHAARTPRTYTRKQDEFHL